MPRLRDILDKIDNGMTVSMLMEELEQLDPQAIVLFSCSYGDYGNTQQALPVESAEAMTTNELTTSAYSHSGVALVRDDPSDEPDDETVDVVILR